MTSVVYHCLQPLTKGYSFPVGTWSIARQHAVIGGHVILQGDPCHENEGCFSHPHSTAEQHARWTGLPRRCRQHSHNN